MKFSAIKTIAAALVLSQAAVAYASDKSVTVFPAEGNKQCSDYAANSTILQMGTNSPTLSGTLAGPDSPYDANSINESASYAVVSGNTVSFANSTTPIDFAILKSGRSVSVMIYPSGGVTSDTNMKLLVNNQALQITGISLCYGLGNTPPPPPEATTIPSCDTLSGFDGLTITCPTNVNKRSIIFNFELGESFYNISGTPLACVCNSPALVECDPNIASDQPGACADPAGSYISRGLEVPTTVDMNNDPYVCTTVGGTRKCYQY